MKKVFLFVLLAIPFLLLQAQTVIPGGVLTDLHWVPEGNPYTVTGEIDLQAGDLLQIDAGVVVEFTGHYKFLVHGRILANGTLTNPIFLQASDHISGWHGLRFLNTNTNGQNPSELHFCVIRYGKATGTGADYRGGAIYALNSDNLIVNNCQITDNSATTGGAVYLDNSAITLSNSTISSNVVTGAGGGIYLNNSDAVLSHVIIADNISQFDGGGLNCFASNVVMEYVLIHDNFTQWNGGGLSAFNYSTLQISHSTISRNIANQSGSGLVSLYNSNIQMVNSIVWDNALNNIYVENTAQLNATYSNLQFGSNQPYFGTGCINADPLFNNPIGGDFSLTWINIPTPDETKSPCIDTGDPNSALDPDGTRADMGAFFFAQNGITGIVTLEGGNGNVAETMITATLQNPPFTVYTTNPDANGNYNISLFAGTYNINASLTGYSPYIYNNLSVLNGLITLNITLTTPPPGVISGQVTVEGIGNPGNVTVSAANVSTNPYPITNPSYPYNTIYVYNLEIAPGVYDVIAELPGYETQVQDNIVVQSGQQTSNIDFYLPLVVNAGMVEGTVFLVGGTGNVMDVIISANGESTSPDADGTYQLELMNGSYNISASLNGYSTQTNQNVQVIAFQSTTNTDFHLIDGWSPITGTQYVMVAYLTVTYDGRFKTKTGSNQLAAFGYDQATGTIEECRGLASWGEGSHSFWNNYWPLEGYWYLTIVSNNDSGLENIWFRFFDQETGQIADCNEQINFIDNTIYPGGVDLTIESPYYDAEYDLIQNWNWISFYLKPDSESFYDIFDPLVQVPDINYVKSQTEFGMYDPPSQLWVGGLDNISYHEGYKVNMFNPYQGFVFTGQMMNPLLFPVEIIENYNWISYFYPENLSLDDALESIGVVDGTVIKTQAQSAVYFGGWIGDLQIMQPGKSYLLDWPLEIQAGDNLYLTYPPITESREVVLPAAIVNPARWEPIGGSESNMIVLTSVFVDKDLLTNNQDYSVGVFDEEGYCRSLGVLQRDLWYFTVVGAEEDILEFRLYDNGTGQIETSFESFIYEVNGVIGKPDDTFKVNFKIKDNPIETADRFIIQQNYPNPFNPQTVISYQIPEDGKVEINIYNARGQLVETLINRHQNAGEYRIEWKADRYSSGIYFYKMSWNNTEEIRKCILLK
jgi:hypothetical protein